MFQMEHNIIVLENEMIKYWDLKQEMDNHI